MNIRDFILGVAIAILTIFVVVYGISIFFPKPDYSDFCKEPRYSPITSPEKCIESGGNWINDSNIKGGFCEGYKLVCEEDYRKAFESRAKKVFLIAIPLGILLVLAGGFLITIESISIGFMFGGIETILYGAGVYWAIGGDLFKFVLSVLGLSAVLYLSYWFSKKGKKHKISAKK